MFLSLTIGDLLEIVLSYNDSLDIIFISLPNVGYSCSNHLDGVRGDSSNSSSAFEDRSLI